MNKLRVFLNPSGPLERDRSSRKDAGPLKIRLDLLKRKENFQKIPCFLETSRPLNRRKSNLKHVRPLNKLRVFLNPSGPLERDRSSRKDAGPLKIRLDLL